MTNNFESFEAMDLDSRDEFGGGDQRGSSSAATACSICLELVVDRGDRSVATLHCGHEFHLDCIGSAFNAKGTMQCPNCRKIENGRWLYANGHLPSANSGLDGWHSQDSIDLGYSELPFGFRWCPHRGIAQLASFIEAGDVHYNSFHDSMGNIRYGENSRASNSAHLCPHLALHGLSHSIHTFGPSDLADLVPEILTFPGHSVNLGGGTPSADMLNSRTFTGRAPQNNNRQPQHLPSPFAAIIAYEQTMSLLGLGVSQSDIRSQQRVGSFMHSHPLPHSSGPRSGSNLVASMGSPFTRELRGHTHARGHGSDSMYHQSLSSSSHAQLPPDRRTRAREIALGSSLAVTSSSAEIGGLHGFASSSANRNHPEANIARNVDRFHGGNGRERLTPLPWIPLEGEPRWWGPFNPNPEPQTLENFLQNVDQQRAGVGEGRPENGYQRMPPATRMPPPPYM